MGYTKGPWGIWKCPTDDEPQAVINSDNGFIAQTLGGNDLANATLISAAPELLEALEDIVTRCFGINVNVSKARAAINKAKGY